MVKEKPVSYKSHNDGSFSIENYNSAKPFSNFLPCVAGLYGIPIWAFYVNRGQGIAGFGLQDKDHAIMEFMPANKAYGAAPLRGFRTFLKISKGKTSEFYEPFQNSLYGQRFDTVQTMHTRPAGFGVEERNMSLGIEVSAEFFGLPGENFGALARKVVFKNNQLVPLEFEAIDGLSVIIPFGLNDQFLKHMSRTVEAWMLAEKLKSDPRFSVYKIKADPYDRPEYQNIEGVHFMGSFLRDANDPKKVLIPRHILDAESVFGGNLDFADPRAFLSPSIPFEPLEGPIEGRTPCAFNHFRAVLGPGQSTALYSYIGQVDRVNRLTSQAARLFDPAYFESKRRENDENIRRIKAAAFTASASREYDLYSEQMYLDNTLRGGFPKAITSGRDKAVLHVFSRKHGDLERDYNNFVIHPTYLSQGEGNYRDMNQNRRSETFFNPEAGDSSPVAFFNLIQIDGYNPLVLKELRLQAISESAAKKHLKGVVAAADLDKVAVLIGEPLTPGEILNRLEDAGIALKVSADQFLEAALKCSEKRQSADHEQGFWSDHWTYNLDLLENYLAVFPEELESLLLKKKELTYYDNPHYVKARVEKYVRVPGGAVRQFNAVGFDPEKQALIRSRQEDPNCVRTRWGKGKVYRASLLAKMICLVLNKLASLDPEGIGLEMEADRPDWLDSLNGLPALLGSSISGTMELRRLVAFLVESLAAIEPPKTAAVALPVEQAMLLQKLKLASAKYLASRNAARSMDFWEKTHEAKEKYWEETRLGLKGTEKRIRLKDLRKTLAIFRQKLDEALARSFDAGKEICPTYFVNELVEFKTAKKKVRVDGLTVLREQILPRKFKQRRLPPFLEGPVHALKVESDPARARQIYNMVRSSPLFDRKLGMYRVCAPLDAESPEIGRVRVFSPGWLENQSIFLHMEYKFLLELLKKGLAEEFFSDMRTALVAFQDPKVYGRSIFENSSFIVSSAFFDRKMHGVGFAPRLSGSTSEFLEMWLVMNIGRKPFFTDDHGKLALRFNPTLAPWLFTEADAQKEAVLRAGKKIEFFLPKNSFAFLFLGHTLITYHNPRRAATYGPKRAVVKRIMFQDAKGETVMIHGDVLPAPHALAVREGRIARLDVELG